MAKYVYLFSEGDASMKIYLAVRVQTAEMTSLGLPVPEALHYN